MNNKTLVIDSFPLGFDYEFPMLELRLEELSDVVDYHILVECSKSQTRIDKPFYYSENKHLFEKFNHKIIPVQVEEYRDGGEANWSQEWFTRQQILTGLQTLQDKIGQLDLFNSYLLINDLDELPSASKLKEIIDSRPDDIVVMNLRFIAFLYDLWCPHRGWWGTCITNLANVRNGWSPQAIRNNKDKFENKIGKWSEEFHGWHLSSCFSWDSIWAKYHNNIEPHNKSFLKEPGAKEQYEKLFNQIVKEQKKFFYCDDFLRDDIKLEQLSLDKLPNFIQSNPEKFKHLFL